MTEIEVRGLLNACLHERVAGVQTIDAGEVWLCWIARSDGMPPVPLEVDREWLRAGCLQTTCESLLLQVDDASWLAT